MLHIGTPVKRILRNDWRLLGEALKGVLEPPTVKNVQFSFPRRSKHFCLFPYRSSLICLYSVYVQFTGPLMFQLCSIIGAVYDPSIIQRRSATYLIFVTKCQIDRENFLLYAPLDTILSERVLKYKSGVHDHLLYTGVIYMPLLISFFFSLAKGCGRF